MLNSAVFENLTDCYTLHDCKKLTNYNEIIENGINASDR